MQIKFPFSESNSLAGRYLLNNQPRKMILEARIETTHALEVQRRGYYTKPELMDVLYWKVPNMRDIAECNDEQDIISITRDALSTQDEAKKIKKLVQLQGVSWLSASVLLHFGSKVPCPILDRRCCWSAGYEYTGKFDPADWLEYVKICRIYSAGPG